MSTKCEVIVVHSDREIEISSKKDDVIESVSCVNLRTESGEDRKCDGKIMVVCTLCGKKKQLGRSTVSVVKVDFLKGSEVFCDKCMDVFTEMCVFGLRVINQASVWELSSQVARVSVVHDNMTCLRCSNKSAGHLYIKYYDVTRMVRTGRRKSVHFVKVCGVCASELIGWLKQSSVLKNVDNVFKFKQKSLENEFIYSAARSW